MEISFSEEELRATVGLNASIEEAMDAEDDPEEFEHCLLSDVAGWVIELRRAKGDASAEARAPEFQEVVIVEPMALMMLGTRGEDLRRAIRKAAVAAVTC